MNKEEMICKNCKYHYIEEISFDYPQSCCDKRKAVIEEWFNCNDFEYSNKYIEQLQQENNQLKCNWNKLKEYLNYKSERAVEEYEYIYDEIYNEMQELKQGSDK